MKENNKNSKKIIYKPKNPDLHEQRSFDLTEISQSKTQKFADDYHSYYDDMKNTNKTEDW